MSKSFILTALFSVIISVSFAQKQKSQMPFTIRLEPMEIVDFPALHSFAFGTSNGKWLIVGGRIEGLHRRQPFAAFNEEGQNKFIYVADPVTKQVWKKSIQHLGIAIWEQLQSTNMQFVQAGNKLILTGGYGYSKTSDDHITYPYLTIIDIDAAIQSIINDEPMAQAIEQIKDERMAVTGGRMAKFGDTLLLVGGHRFDGRYNPMGPDHGPGFSQQYTNEIRRFNLDFNKPITELKNYRAEKDTVNLHRRDYNLIPQIFPGNQPGFTIFSGVFQYEDDLPFTTMVDIKGETHKVDNEFHQKFSHYQSSVLPVYEQETETMSTIFFGGIARYYPNNKGDIMDNPNVPFTKTISLVTRKNGQTKETYFPLQMPGYLGAAAEFILAPDTKIYTEGIADAVNLKNEEKLVGYIVGGINSSDKNIFWKNTGKESKANNSIIKVFIKKNL